MMYILIAVILVLVLILTALSVYLLVTLRGLKEGKDKDQSFLMIQNQLNSVTQTLENRLAESTKMIHQQLAQGTNVVQKVTEKLTRLDETNNRVVGFAQQLQRLEHVLRNPKQRGIYGEYLLDNILGNTLAPGQFQTQYRFKTGEIVDAVIFVQDKIVPVDAKFSLTNYHRYLETEEAVLKDRLERQIWADLKERINETKKYVKPSENTTDFALMFIPGEGMFHHLLTSIDKRTAPTGNNDLLSYAFSQRVIIVTPSTFFAYLQVIMQALQALQVKESIDDVLKHLRKMVSHVKRYDEYMKRLGKNIQMVIGSYNDAYKNLRLLNNDMRKLTPDTTTEVTPMVIDKSQVENDRL